MTREVGHLAISLNFEKNKKIGCGLKVSQSNFVNLNESQSIVNLKVRYTKKVKKKAEALKY